MNLKLNYEGFEDNLYSVYASPIKKEASYTFTFNKTDCEITVKIFKDSSSFGHKKDLWEVKYDVKFYDSPFIYSSSIDGIIGNKTDKEVKGRLRNIKEK